jgi:hypothetical protein
VNSERIINLAERAIGMITAERLRGMEPQTIVINTDDYATMCIENGVPPKTLWSFPLEHSGTLPPGSVLMTSAGPG